MKVFWIKCDELLLIVGDYFCGYKIIVVLKGNKIGKVFKWIYIYIYSDVKIYNDLVFGVVGLGKIDKWN